MVTQRGDDFEVVEPIRRDNGELTRQISNEAVEAVKYYLERDSWAELVPLIRTPNLVRPNMEAYYERHPYRKREGAKLIVEGLETGAKRDQVYRPEFTDKIDIISLAMAFPDNTGQFFAVERRKILGTDDDYEYLIDWEVSEMFHPVSLDEFRDSRESGAEAEFRVLLNGKVSWHIEPFSDTDVWHGFELTRPGLADFKLMGYVRKASPVYKELTDLFLYGEHPIPLVKVKYPDGRVYDSEAVEIIEVIQSTWYAKE